MIHTFLDGTLMDGDGLDSRRQIRQNIDRLLFSTSLRLLVDASRIDVPQ